MLPSAVAQENDLKADGPAAIAANEYPASRKKHLPPALCLAGGRSSHRGRL